MVTKSDPHFFGGSIFPEVRGEVRSLSLSTMGEEYDTHFTLSFRLIAFLIIFSFEI